MENTKRNVAAEVKAHRQEAAAYFQRMERRLEAIDHLVTAAAEVSHCAVADPHRSPARAARERAVTE